MRHGCLIHAIGRVRLHGGKKRGKKRGEKTKSRRTQNTPPKPRQHGARTQLETAKQVPRVSPSSPAYLDAEFVEIGHVQLSQSMTMRENTDRQYTTDRQTGRPHKQLIEAYTHPAMKRPFCLQARNGLVYREPLMFLGHNEFRGKFR